MDINQDLFEKIEAYLQGDLSEDQRMAFEDQLASNPELAEAINRHRVLQLGAEAGALREKLEQIHQRVTRPNSRPLRWAYVLAAAIALLFAFALLFQRFRPPTHERIYAALHTTDPGLPVRMGISDAPEFDDAMVDFKEGNFDQAKNKFTRLLADHPANDTLLLYLGLCHLEIKEPGQALGYFEKITLQDALLYQKAQWYSALAFVRVNQLQNACILLQAILKVPGHRFYQQAREGAKLLECAIQMPESSIAPGSF